MFSSKIDNQFIKFIKPEFVHADDRGSLTQIVSKLKWAQVNYIDSKPSSIRGNHYHKFNRELFFVIEGKFILTLELDGKKLVYEMIKNDIFIIEPLVRHSFEYLDNTKLITMYNKGVELEGNKKDIEV